MKHGITLTTFCLAIFLLASCNTSRDSKNQPNDPKTGTDTFVSGKKKATMPPPRLFAGEIESSWKLLCEGTPKIRFDSQKNASVQIDFWENGKRSERIAAVAQSLISPGGEVDVAVHEADHDGNRVYRISIGDGLGPNATQYEFPAGVDHVLSPLPREIVLLDGVTENVLFLCVGRDCKLDQGESAQDVARRAEYAIVVSLSEVAKK